MLELEKSFRSSSYYKLASSLHSHPLFYYVSGNRHRSDFIYANTKTGVPLLYLWDPVKREGRLLTPGDEPIFPQFGSATLHPSKPLVIYGKDKGGNSDYAIYLLDYSSNELRQIKGPMGRVFYIFWVDDDRWIIVGHDKEAVYARMLLLDGTTKDLYITNKQILGADYDEERRQLVISVGRGEDAKLAIIDITGNREVRWVPESGIPPFYPPSVWPDSGYLAYSVDKKTHQELVVRSIETMDEIARAAILGFGSMQWFDAGHLFGIILRDGRMAPHTFDLNTREWSASLAEVSALFSTITQDGPVWVANSFFQPPFLQAIRNGKLETLIPPSGVSTGARTESHYYPSFDGRIVQGWLLRNSDPKAPVVIYLHGGPTALTADYWWPEIPALVMAGYHVFAPNFRGSDGFGAEFRDLNIGDIGGGDLKDVVYGAKYAANLLSVDQKPAVVGGSYGAYLALLALTLYPDEWTGGVAIAAPTDCAEEYNLADSHYRFFYTHFLGGTPQEKPELYRERSPITHLAKLKTPVLMLHGENDSLTPLEPVKKFYQKAKEMKLPVDLVITKDEGHGSLQDMNAIRDTVLTLEHLQKLFSNSHELRI